MKTLRQIVLAATLIAGAAGCGSRSSAGAGGTGGAGGGGAGVPLVDWVTDLAVNYVADMTPPDTVDDKVIIDTTDPAAFDALLGI